MLVWTGMSAVVGRQDFLRSCVPKLTMMFTVARSCCMLAPVIIRYRGTG
ncbi:hypothetical protein [Methylobacterium sp. Leaf102]|nr:hypothetical protein [Methylobacterium sp. Leaf102]